MSHSVTALAYVAASTGPMRHVDGDALADSVQRALLHQLGTVISDLHVEWDEEARGVVLQLETSLGAREALDALDQLSVDGEDDERTWEMVITRVAID